MFQRILLFPALFVLLSVTIDMDEYVRVMTSVMTYNIHIEHCEEQPQSWDDRKAMIAQVIHSRAPEIMGLQGATLGQTDWLNSALKDYEYYAPTSHNLEMGTDMCPILFNRETYDVIDQGTYLIGEAIQKDESHSDSETVQFLNWVKLKHKTSQKEIYVLNTKIDLDSGHDKLLITKRLEESIEDLVEGGTFIFLADMAHNPETEVIKEIMQWANDSEANSLVSISDREATNPGWNRVPSETGERVDYVFLSFDIPANSYEVLDVAYNGEYPSDHLPVFCRLRIQ